MTSIIKKRDLALRYFPESNPKSAIRRLMRWVNHNHELREALRKAGYHKEQRYFTEVQIELIIYYLCEP